MTKSDAAAQLETIADNLRTYNVADTRKKLRAIALALKTKGKRKK